MIRNLIKLPLAYSFLLLITIMIPSTGSANEVLKWTGCGITMKAFMAEAALAYQEKTGGKVAIKLSGGGATKGIRFANAGLSEMGGTCRPSLPDRFPEMEGEALLTVVGWDALVPIVHKENPIDSLTSEQFKQIMMGDIKNWSMVGGPDQAIQVVARTGKISGVGFMSRLMIFNDQETEFNGNAKIVKSSGPLEKYVEKNKWAIGISGVSSARRREVKLLAIEGKDATVKNIAAGDYPFFRPLYIATQGEPTGEVKKFLEWLLSAEGQEVVKKCGTVTLEQGRDLKKKFKFWLNTDRIINFDML